MKVPLIAPDLQAMLADFPIVLAAPLDEGSFTF